MAETVVRPAFYAARQGSVRDWWTLLHPPYTAWHLSYVVLGACLAPSVDTTRLLATLGAFFLAVGLAAHALDELHGRPLRTQIPNATLIVAAAAGLAGSLLLGVLGMSQVGWTLLVFMLAGTFLVLAYDLEWFGGVVHTDAGFAAAWGAFPVLTACFAQTGGLTVIGIIAAASAYGFTSAQRCLSNRARHIRRRTRAVEGVVTLTNGRQETIDADYLLEPIEQALRALSWSLVLIAAAIAILRLL
ncbi:MAG TPA: hypothetical protein VK009_18350 [Chloroflexota bacterium]|nr:hypothetical protein [Chloroflexota bacterium]